jgi:hypothetical protein
MDGADEAAAGRDELHEASNGKAGVSGMNDMFIDTSGSLDQSKEGEGCESALCSRADALWEIREQIRQRLDEMVNPKSTRELDAFWSRPRFFVPASYGDPPFVDSLCS